MRNFLVAVVVVSCFCASQSHGTSPEPPQWEVEGRYADACRCQAPCPCHFNQDVEFDTCDPTLVYHIENGRYEDVALDGLSIVVFLEADPERFYVDTDMGKRQRNALQEIARALTSTLLREGYPLSGREILKQLPLEVDLTESKAQARIPGVLNLQTEALVGGDGKSRIQLSNLNLGPGWMHSVWAGRSKVYKYSDAKELDYSGRNAYFGRFRANSNMAVIQAGASAPRE
jgi:hypothetical protein